MKFEMNDRKTTMISVLSLRNENLRRHIFFLCVCVKEKLSVGERWVCWWVPREGYEEDMSVFK